MINRSNTVRLFVALDMPVQIKNIITAVQQKLKQCGYIEGKLIQPDQTHLTLAFIGSVEPDAIPAIVTALQLVKSQPFVIKLGPIDVFMHRNVVRIIFLTLLSSQLSLLAAQIATVLMPWVVASDRDFVNHVTLARVKKVYDMTRLLSCIQDINVEPIEYTINYFVLKESRLMPEGVIYIDRARFNFE